MADNEIKEIKVVKKEKKPGFLRRTPGRIAKWFREMRSELKKVSWPTFKQVVNNSGIVLMAILIVGLIVSAFDFGWGKVVEAIINIKL